MANSQFTTSVLVPSPRPSPLMRPIGYQGQTYFSSQYFHQQYLANSPHGGKHRRYGSFMRLLQGIETYREYLARGDIILLAWNEEPDGLNTKTGSVNKDAAFKSLFSAAGYHPLTLINATAQAALSHHLDDELSKQMSVAINTQTARQLGRKSVGQSTPLELATRDMVAWMDAAKIFATPLHIALQEGVKTIAGTYGVDFRPLLKAAPSQDHIPEEERMLEPTELAKQLGQSSGRVINVLLEEIGWQVKQLGSWQPTPVGEPFSTPHAWTSDHGTQTGYNYKWRLSALRQALKQAGLIT